MKTIEMTANKGMLKAGEIVTVTVDDADRLIAKGLAVAVSEKGIGKPSKQNKTTGE